MNFNNDEELKNEYLDYIKRSYEGGTTAPVEFVLKTIDDYEDTMEAHVYNFNEEVMLGLLGRFNSSTRSVLIPYKSLVSQYLTFVSDRTSSIGLDSILNLGTSDLDKVINKTVGINKYLTKNEYLKFLEEAYNIVNVQDLCIIVLLWNGIKGKDYEDVRNIKTSNYDIEKSCVNYNNRIIKLEKIESKIVRDTVKEKLYMPYRFSLEENRKIKRGIVPVQEYDLNMDNDALIKPYTDSDCPESSYNVKIRLAKMFKMMDLKFLTGVQIYTSGCMYHMLEDNRFNVVPYMDMVTWLKDRELKVSSNKLTELRDLLLKKLHNEGIVAATDEIEE